MQKPRVSEALLIICVALVAALSGCAGSERDDNVSLDGTEGGGASGSGSEVVLVRGTQTCDLTILPRGPSRDGAQVFNERFDCIDVMSDPRVSGTEVLEIETLYYERHSGLWTAVGTISNDDGSWQGGGAGILRMEGDSPYNYGEMTFTGEGAYAGLIYRYLVAGSDEDLVITGWIEQDGSSE